MQQMARHFAEQLNKILDEMDAPAAIRDRASVLSKILDIPKQDAWSYLEGHTLPNQETLERIAEELEISVDDLTGQNQKDED